MTAAALLLLGGCGDEADGAAGGGGAGGASEPAPATCPEGSTPRTIRAAAADPGSGCIDLAAELAIEVCETAAGATSGFLCLEETATGRRIWLDPASTLVDASAWAACDAATPPPPCSTGGCPGDAPSPVGDVVSTCSDEDTRDAYRCGDPTSPWDATCCPRPSCDDAGGCPPGMICVEAGHQSYVSCARSAGGSCACGGTLDGRISEVCVPE